MNKEDKERRAKEADELCVFVTQKALAVLKDKAEELDKKAKEGIPHSEDSPFLEQAWYFLCEQKNSYTQEYPKKPPLPLRHNQGVSELAVAMAQNKDLSVEERQKLCDIATSLSRFYAEIRRDGPFGHMTNCDVYSQYNLSPTGEILWKQMRVK